MNSTPAFARSVHGFFLPLMALALSSCGVDQVGFTPLEFGQLEPTPAPSPTPSCSVSSTQQKLRILVMVDNSGSTADTDPNQDYRVDTFERFLSNYGTRDNLTYGFGYFDDEGYFFDHASARFRTGTVTAPIGSAAQARAAFRSYQGISPDGNTNYKQAFASLQSAIIRDQGLGGRQNYVVIFMSDGQPTDLSGNVANEIRKLVNGLKSQAQAGGTQLTVSAVYFGPRVDADSISNLKAMAAQGGGQFVDTNALGSGGLEIDDVITIPGCSR